MPLCETSLAGTASSGFSMRESTSFCGRELATIIEPFYPKPERAGRQTVGSERMLRIHGRS